MTKTILGTTAALTLILGFSAPALGQQQQQQQGAQTQQQAQACIEEMNAFAQRMNQDQFWFTGWDGYGTPATPMGGTTAATGTMDTTDQTQPLTGFGTDPRVGVEGMGEPRTQIRALYSAAQVLAHRGDQEGCSFVLARMSGIYDEYTQRLSEAGIDPQAVTTWRQEQLALAQPLAQSEGMSSYTVGNIVGSDVRNPNDENLGSVNDLIIDPATGTAGYIIVARGGFLGLGQDHYAVPWDQVNATPGLNTIVLNMSEAELEQAPSVDPDRFRNPATMGEERQATDDFWGGRG